MGTDQIDAERQPWMEEVLTGQRRDKTLPRYRYRSKQLLFRVHMMY